VAPEEAKAEIVTFLMSCAPALSTLSEGKIREWIHLCIQQAELARVESKWKENQKLLQEQIRKAARSLLEAMDTADQLFRERTRTNVCPEESEHFESQVDESLTVFLTLESPCRFKGELDSLTRIGVQKDAIRLAYRFPDLEFDVYLEPPKQRTKDPIPADILELHSRAKLFLEYFGIKPAMGSWMATKRKRSGNVARLGALLCAAAGLLPKAWPWESTAAARLTFATDEAIKHAGISLREAKPWPKPSS